MNILLIVLYFDLIRLLNPVNYTKVSNKICTKFMESFKHLAFLHQHLYGEVFKIKCCYSKNDKNTGKKVNGGVHMFVSTEIKHGAISISDNNIKVN